MNFVEAHMLVHDYFGVFASSAVNPLYGYPEEKLPFYRQGWRDDIIAAYQLFLSHSILWNDREEKYIDQAFSLLRQISYFIPEHLYLDGKSSWDIVQKSLHHKLWAKINKKKVEEAKNVLTNYTKNPA